MEDQEKKSPFGTKQPGTTPLFGSSTSGGDKKPSIFGSSSTGGESIFKNPSAATPASGESKPSGSLFAANKKPDEEKKEGGGLFGTSAKPSGSSGLFGGSKPSQPSTTGLFGKQSAGTTDSKPVSCGIFASANKPDGDKPKQSSPFGSASTSAGNKEEGKDANSKPKTSLFGASVSTGDKKASSFTLGGSSAGSMFGKKPDDKKDADKSLGFADPGGESKKDKPASSMFAGSGGKEGGSIFNSGPQKKLFGDNPKDESSTSNGGSLFKPKGQPSTQTIMPTGDGKSKSPFQTGEGKPPSLTSSKPPATSSIFNVKKDDKKEDSKAEEKKESGSSLKPTALGNPTSSSASPFGSKSDSKPSAGSIFGGKKDDAFKDPNKEGVKGTAADTSEKKEAKPSPFGGFSKTEEKKEERKEDSGSQPAAKPEIKASEQEVIKKMSLDDAKKDQLSYKRLEDIISGWYNKVENQSEAFAKHAKQLKLEEVALQENIETLDTLNEYSERLVQDYTSTLSAMQDMARQQEELMKVLDKIDDEVDSALKTDNKALDGIHRLRHSVHNREFIDVTRTNYRDQMDVKTESINLNLNTIEDKISTMSNILFSTSDHRTSESNGEHTEVNRVLNNSYESLRWIQDTAADLNYQIELLDNQLRNL